MAGFGDKFLVARPGSGVYLFGQERTPWVRLTRTAQAGTTTLQLEDNDWRVGDRIAIAPTDFDQYQAEYVSIVARNGNTVTIDRPLDYMHYCGTETYGGRSITECAEVGLLSRNITIQGDEASAQTQIGGHTMYHRGSTIRIQGVEFWRMGQVGRTGRYPAHFHLFGSATGSFFQQNSMWHTYNRWITLHGVQDLRLIDNVGFDTIGHGYYLEDGDEIRNLILGNLGILTREAEPGQLVTPSDDSPAVFWITNPDNAIVNNVAAGGDHSGFWFALPERPLGSSTADLWPRQTPLDIFFGNVAHSVGFAGLMVDRGERPDRTLETTWYNPVANPGDPDSALVPPKFNQFTAYKSRHYGMWVRTFSGGSWHNLALADNWRSVYLANIQAGGDRQNRAVITNSLMVGETANVGQPHSWETTGTGGRSLPKFWDPEADITGVPFYDGPLRVSSTMFANFNGNGQRDAGALSTLEPNPFWISPANDTWNLSFQNAQRVLFPETEQYVDGDATSLFTDWDGSVTGRRGASVTAQDALLDNRFCEERPEWNAMQCHPGVGFLSVSMNRLDGQWARVNIERNDGRSFGFDGADERDNKVFFTMTNDQEHRLTWEAGTPREFNLFVPNVAKMNGRGARLVLPVPSGNWEFQVNGQRESAASLSALSSGPSNWYYDAQANEIHLRLVGDSNWVTMR